MSLVKYHSSKLVLLDVDILEKKFPESVSKQCLGIFTIDIKVATKCNYAFLYAILVPAATGCPSIFG